MTIKKVYIGSVGPFEYDDTESVGDPDFPGETRKALLTSGAVRADDGAAPPGTHSASHVPGGSDEVFAELAAVADAAAVTSLTLSAGSDQVNRADFNTKLATLVTEINAIKSQLNVLLARIRTHDLIAT